MEDYELILEPFIYSITQFENKGKTTLGDKSNRECIYCGKVKGEVTFKKEAHVIPASLGNRTLFNYNECDNCNEHYFGVHENELANYLMLDRVFTGSRKRNGLPTYKPNPKGDTSIRHMTDSNTVAIKIDDIDGRFEIIQNESLNQLTYRINEPLPYRLADICKALTHMVWPFLSLKQRNELKHIPDWLLGKYDIFPLYLDKLFVPGNGYSNVMLECWEHTDPKALYPLLVRFTFGTKILSFYIPKSRNISIPPKRYTDYIQIPDKVNVTFDPLIIKDNQRSYPKDLSFTFKYSSISEKTTIKE
ncbi:HNH endonuclease [Priestia koreensis]|uniref:HNH endonuclease n=1 Tax=Priestia koreensis TaxID=284581 RepID=UPI0006A9CA44|nr:HNH endonuclease [Priestia koreensis]